jgi:hypothetical protein
MNGAARREKGSGSEIITIASSATRWNWTNCATTFATMLSIMNRSKRILSRIVVTLVIPTLIIDPIGSVAIRDAVVPVTQCESPLFQTEALANRALSPHLQTLFCHVRNFGSFWRKNKTAASAAAPKYRVNHGHHRLAALLHIVESKDLGALKLSDVVGSTGQTVEEVHKLYREGRLLLGQPGISYDKAKLYVQLIREYGFAINTAEAERRGLIARLVTLGYQAYTNFGFGLLDLSETTIDDPMIDLIPGFRNFVYDTTSPPAAALGSTSPSAVPAQKKQEPGAATDQTETGPSRISLGTMIEEDHRGPHGINAQIKGEFDSLRYDVPNVGPDRFLEPRDADNGYRRRIDFSMDNFLEQFADDFKNRDFEWKPETPPTIFFINPPADPETGKPRLFWWVGGRYAAAHYSVVNHSIYISRSFTKTIKCDFRVLKAIAWHETARIAGLSDAQADAIHSQIHPTLDKTVKDYAEQERPEAAPEPDTAPGAMESQSNGQAIAETIEFRSPKVSDNSFLIRGKPFFEQKWTLRDVVPLLSEEIDLPPKVLGLAVELVLNSERTNRRQSTSKTQVALHIAGYHSDNGEIYKITINQANSTLEDWQRLRINAEGVARQGIGYLSLENRANRLRDGAIDPQHGGGGLSVFETLCNAFETKLRYTRFREGQVHTELWMKPPAAALSSNSPKVESTASAGADAAAAPAVKPQQTRGLKISA